MKTRTVVEFEIKSLDPTRSASKAVLEVQRLQAELQSVVAKKFPKSNVRISRGEGLPGIPELQHILLHIDWDVVIKAVETAIATFATTELLKLMKKRIKNVAVEKVPPEKMKSLDQGKSLKKSPGKKGSATAMHRKTSKKR